MAHLRRKSTFVIMYVFALIAISCSHKDSTAVLPVQNDMRHAYGAWRELFSYVWDSEAFQSKSNESTITQLLDELSRRFHHVENSTFAASSEPGLKVTLEVNNELLQDVRNRFSSGSKDYAAWRLRSLSSNCIACHTRRHVAVDFVGVSPQVHDSSLESQVAAVQFLIATRQFEHAESDLLRLIDSLSRVSSTERKRFELLKEWLLVQVRVIGHYTNTEKALRELEKKYEWESSHQQSFARWRADLKSLDESRVGIHSVVESSETLNWARRVQEKYPTEPTIQQDEERLVTSLAVSSALHRVFETEGANLSVEKRAEGTLLLALAYKRMPINSLEAFVELYLEQCIREFPGTPSAQKAYDALDSYLKENALGSSGLNLDPETIERLSRLHNLAFGK